MSRLRADGTRTPAGRAGSTARARPIHPAFMVVLAVVFLAAVLRLAVPSLTGGGNLKPFTPVIPARHLVARNATPATGGSATATTVAPGGRDPFTPPSGY
jgi:hypothetical protein